MCNPADIWEKKMMLSADEAATTNNNNQTMHWAKCMHDLHLFFIIVK